MGQRFQSIEVEEEMTEGSPDVGNRAVRQSETHQHIHFRQREAGKIPCYDEVFLDEGDIDMSWARCASFRGLNLTAC